MGTITASIITTPRQGWTTPQNNKTETEAPNTHGSPDNTSFQGNSQTLKQLAREPRPAIAGNPASAAETQGAPTGQSELNLDAQGHVQHEKVHLKTSDGRDTISSNIERKAMPEVHGLVIHQTDSLTASATLDSYSKEKANGAHFLIDRDGTIYQTASLSKSTNHVGKLKSRCALDDSCTSEEKKQNAQFNPKAENERESVKAPMERFPSNSDSIGIEIVGKAFKAEKHTETVNPDGSSNIILTTKDGKTLIYQNLSGETLNLMREEIKQSENSKPKKEYLVFESVTEKQNQSLQWLVAQLKNEFDIPASEVFAHPVVSRKTGSEASTANWGQRP